MSLIMSRRDLDFLLHEWLKVEDLTARERFAEHSRETFDGALDLAEQVATDYFAGHNRKADLNEPAYDGRTVHLIPEVQPALRAFVDAGFLSAPLDEADGGEQLPFTVYCACMSWFHAANAGTTGYALLTSGAANLIRAHGSAEQIEAFAVPMTQGRFLGTMALSEPQAGSNLADLTTRAQPQPDGTYRLFGRKMWISGGDNELAENIVHLVLARTPGAPAGTRGISLFIVPKYLANGERNDIVLAGINHKLGFRGTVNTAPVFGDGAFTPDGAAGAVGYLVGAEHRGLPLMFAMMNEARISIGLCATALGYTGYLKSLDYARGRLQGRPVGVAPTQPQVPLTEHPDVRRMLLAQKAYVEGALALTLYCARLIDEGDEQLLGLLIPIVKSWPSQYGLAANDLAIQVLGGAGYTRDFDIEQHYRDNRLNPIHEGTHGIQAMDLLGRKVLGDGGAALRVLLGRMQETARRATDPEGAGFAEALLRAADDLGATTAALGALGDPAAMLADATLYLEACGHVVVAWLWLEQWIAASGKDGPFYEGKRAAARYFFTRELPRAAGMLEVLRAADGLTLRLDPTVL